MSKDQLSSAIAPKLDFVMFKEFERKQLEKEANNENEMRTEERLFKIEQRMQASMLRSDFDNLMSEQVTAERVEEMDLIINRISQQLMHVKDESESKMMRLDAELARKTGDLQTFMMELTGRLKGLEDENATDREATDVDVGASKDTRELQQIV